LHSRHKSLSVALATFNGAAYLTQQLQSFVMQSRPPDELIVCDDCSNDSTVELLDAFAANAPFAVKIHRNPSRLGPAQGFAQAIALCKGDLIALSDQDDVWCPEKLARMEACLVESPLIYAVSCNAEIVDEALRPIGFNVWDLVGLSREFPGQTGLELPLSALLKRYRIQGATLVFRSELIEATQPIPKYWNHDAWIAIMAASLGKLWVIPQCLQNYRQHSRNVVGARPGSVLEKMRHGLEISRETYYREEVAKYSALLDRLGSTGSVANSAKAEIADKFKHLSIRGTMSKSRWLRWISVLREVRTGRYRRYATDWRSIAFDLFGT